MELDGSADGATAVAVAMALDDARGQAPPPELDPESRGLWAESARSVGEELDLARELVLDAAGRRPGRAQHRFLLGQAVHAAQGRTRSPAVDIRQWIVPFLLAGSAAPGLDPVFSFLGSAYLDAWEHLPADARGDAISVWKRAFMDPGFVSQSVLSASAAIGRGQVLRLLPDEAAPLRAASGAYAREGDVATVAELRPRLDRALRKERDLGIAKIAQGSAAGDLEGARSACQDWLAKSPATEFDDARGRSQVARVLELWPNDVGGAWRTDPRGELIRFFLNRREKDVRPDALLRATEILTGVPDTVRAQVWLLAGDLAGAEEILRKSGNAGSLEWTPFLVKVARGKLARGEAKGARETLQGLSAAATEGCDVLLTRREIAAALGDQAEIANNDDRLRWLRRDSLPAEAWSASGSMSLCLDGGAAGRKLSVAIEAERPAMVTFGWNGGRQGSILLPRGDGTLTVQLPALTGRQTFSVSSEAGGPIQPGAVAIGPEH